MTYAYVRFSTSHQDEVQQKFALDEYAQSRNVTIDYFEKDEGVSGGVSYKQRNLYKLIRKMRQGDTLITTEISRLGRSMGDISMLLNEELKPKKIRLVIIKMGIDIDCANMKAQDDFLFSALSFAAQLEKEMIQSRTQSSLDAKKELLKREGGFMSKSGRWCTKLGAKKGHDYGHIAGAAAGLAHTRKSQEWKENSDLYNWSEKQYLRGRADKDVVNDAHALYEDDPERWCTMKGKPLSGAIYSKWKRDWRL